VSLSFVTSTLVHVLYFLLVGHLYRNADLFVAYPLMRGLAPLIATAITAVTLRAFPGAVALVGVLALVVAVATMGFSGLAHGRSSVHAQVDNNFNQERHLVTREVWRYISRDAPPRWRSGALSWPDRPSGLGMMGRPRTPCSYFDNACALIKSVGRKFNPAESQRRRSLYLL
jgi:hypothetical protein